METVNFETVKIGNVFHHNRMGYTKISRSYAEVNDISMRPPTLSTSFFNGTVPVQVSK